MAPSRLPSASQEPVSRVPFSPRRRRIRAPNLIEASSGIRPLRVAHRRCRQLRALSKVRVSAFDNVILQAFAGRGCADRSGVTGRAYAFHDNSMTRVVRHFYSRADAFELNGRMFLCCPHTKRHSSKSSPHRSCEPMVTASGGCSNVMRASYALLAMFTRRGKWCGFARRRARRAEKKRGTAGA